MLIHIFEKQNRFFHTQVKTGDRPFRILINLVFTLGLASLGHCQTQNYANLCADAVVTASPGTVNIGGVNDELIPVENSCPEADLSVTSCARVPVDLGSGGAWVRLTFSAPVKLSTIVFLVHDE